MATHVASSERTLARSYDISPYFGNPFWAWMEYIR